MKGLLLADGLDDVGGGDLPHELGMLLPSFALVLSELAQRRLESFLEPTPLRTPR
jgi:hypothetical protein